MVRRLKASLVAFSLAASLAFADSTIAQQAEVASGFTRERVPEVYFDATTAAIVTPWPTRSTAAKRG